MRCTQEQFDSIKDRIIYDIDDIGDFNHFHYITNNYDCKKTKIGNTMRKDLFNREIHETFNADIFLEACGVEVEKVWKGSEMQYKDDNSDWQDCWGGKNRKYRFKPQPDYSQEIEALQQKAKENGLKCVINFEKI